MEYRAGKCAQCGAEYQVPASFAHNVARCKKCGVGVVHLGAPARSAASGAAEAAAPTPPARPAPPEPVSREPARAVLPTAERASGGSERGRPEPQRESASSRASTASAQTPARPRSEPAATAGSTAPAAERARAPRAAIAIGLLLAAAAAFWFFFVRDKGA